jgi:hypothetical protein
MRSRQAANLFQLKRFCFRVFVFVLRTDAEGSHIFFIIADRHAQRAAGAGLFCAGLGDAAGVGLEISHPILTSAS